MQKIARQLSRTGLQALLLVAVTGLGVTSAVAQSNEFSNVKIKNFGKMDDRFFRGAQPLQGDYQVLASLGIKAIVDLRNDPMSYAKSATEAAGMRYINIPMSDKKRPQDTQIDTFLSAVKELGDVPFYVHCAGGRHRTGVMGAVYRFNNYRWDFAKVYDEMKQYDYYSRWGHGALKDYVEDYSQQLQTSGIMTSTSTSKSSSNPK